MKTYLKHLYSIVIAFSLAIGLLGGGMSVCTAAGNLAVLPPHSHPYRMTYSEWSAAWWQWAFSLPVDQHPLFDTADCSEGQSGKVWFLGGTFGTIGGSDRAEVDRDCSIPHGKALFFPIVNIECDALSLGIADDDMLRECANTTADHIQELRVVLDGNEVEHLGLYRAASPLFTIGPLPANNILGEPDGATSVAVSDGYYIMLVPLPAGDHDIHFEGAIVYTIAEDGFDYRFELDADYRIAVVNPLRR